MAFQSERGMIMWKKNIKTMILTSVLILLPIVIGIVFWDQLPEQMATHFGYDGEANGWSSKWFAVFGLPAFLLAVHWFCTLVTEQDPRYEKYPEKMKKFIFWICPACSWLCSLGTYAYELKGKMIAVEWIAAILGFVFIYAGNYMPKVKQNWFLGIKLPWTYASEENWNKTHRFGGKVCVLGGILLLFNILLKIKYLEFVIFAAIVLLPTLYSYFYSKKEKSQERD